MKSRDDQITCALVIVLSVAGCLFWFWFSGGAWLVSQALKGGL